MRRRSRPRPPHHADRTRTSAPLLLAALVAVAALAGCLDDSPAAPDPRAALDLAVQVNGVAAMPTEMAMRTRIGFYHNDAVATLALAEFPFDTTVRLRRMAVDLTPCLQVVPQPAGSPPGCPLFVDAVLVSPQGIIDAQRSETVVAHPGQSLLVPEPIVLTVGSTAPMAKIVQAVWVTSAASALPVVRYVLEAADADGNLRAHDALYLDSLAGISTYFPLRTVPVVGLLRTPGYAFLPPALQPVTPTIRATVYDTKYASAQASAPVAVPDTGAPTLASLAGELGDTLATVSFVVRDPGTAPNPAGVEILLRDPALDAVPGDDALLARCVRPVGASGTQTTASCPVHTALTSVRVYAIPFDSTGHVGSAETTLLSRTP